VRSYFRYKAIPHQWVLRNAASQAEQAGCLAGLRG
jgi:hypothetical protein